MTLALTPLVSFDAPIFQNQEIGELVLQTFDLFLHLKNSFYEIFNQLTKRV